MKWPVSVYTICNDYIPLKECQEKHQVHVCRAASRSCKLHPSLLLAPTDPGFHVIGLSLSPAANGCSPDSLYKPPEAALHGLRPCFDCLGGYGL